MSILSRLFGRQKFVEDIFTSVPGFNGDRSRVNRNNLLQNNINWVFIATDRNAKNFADVPIRLMRQKRTEPEEIENHPALELLAKPHPIVTGREFRYLIAAHKMLAGNAYLLKNGLDRIDRGPVTQLTPLPPTAVRPDLTNDGMDIQQYRIVNGAEPVNLPPEKMLHDRQPNPANPVIGVGTLESIAGWADLDYFINEFNRNYFVNGARLGGFLQSGATTKEQIDLIKYGFNQEHKGVHNMHRWAILPKGVEPAETKQPSLQETQMSDTMKDNRDRILAAFGVPKSVLGITEDVNRSNAEAANYTYMAYTIKPMVQEYVDFLNEQFLPMFGDDKLYFDFDDPVPENKELKVQEYDKALAGQPWMTINEVRAEQGLEPVEGGDELHEPAGNRPAPAENGRRVRFAQRRQRPQHSRQYAAQRHTDRIVTSLKKGMGEAMQEAALEREQNEFAERVDGTAAELAESIRQQDQQIIETVLANVEDSFAQKAVPDSALFDEDEQVRATIDMATPLMESLSADEARRVLDELNADVAFDSSEQRYARALSDGIEQMARTYHATTRQMLQQELQQGMNAGEGLTDLKERVASVLDKSEDYRARRVAHTESFRAANMARKEAMQQSGVVRSIRWYTATDERVCPFCRPKNGDVIDVNERWHEEGETIEGDDGSTMTLDYAAVDGPPLHPNCRCYITANEVTV